MKVLGNATVAFWLLALGYLGFYVYGLLMGVFSPSQMLGFSVAAARSGSLENAGALREGEQLIDSFVQYGEVLDSLISPPVRSSISRSHPTRR